MIFVAATGRTNSYVRTTCKKNNIIPPKFIIADNGGTIFDVRKGEYLHKTEVSHEMRETIIEEYLRAGGKLQEVRYTDGDKVYVAEDADVRQYYKGEDIIEYIALDELLHKMLNSDTSMTKITLAGSKKLMSHMVKFINANSLQCWADIGGTKFPHRLRKNYRLDIMDKSSSKGEALQFLTKFTGVGDFICIGNGMNDFSMFKFAIDSGMPICVVQNFEDGKLSKESEELLQKINEYVAETIGESSGANIRTLDFPINRSLIQLSSMRGQEEAKTASQKRKEFVSKMKVTAKYIPMLNYGATIGHRIQHRER